MAEREAVPAWTNGQEEKNQKERKKERKRERETSTSAQQRDQPIHDNMPNSGSKSLHISPNTLHLVVRTTQRCLCTSHTASLLLHCHQRPERQHPGRGKLKENQHEREKKRTGATEINTRTKTSKERKEGSHDTAISVHVTYNKPAPPVPSTAWTAASRKGIAKERNERQSQRGRKKNEKRKTNEKSQHKIDKKKNGTSVHVTDSSVPSRPIESEQHQVLWQSGERGRETSRRKRTRQRGVKTIEQNDKSAGYTMQTTKQTARNDKRRGRKNSGEEDSGVRTIRGGERERESDRLDLKE